MLNKLLTINAQDVKQMKRKLNKIEPGLRNEFVKEIKAVGRDAAKPIKKAIKEISPLSGMTSHSGKTAWGIGKPIDSTTIRSKLRSGGKTMTTSLVSIRLNSPAINILDMAGRSGRSVGKGKRNSGYTPVVRRTADGGLVAYARRTPAEAGQKFIANLNQVAGVVKRAASRIAWPSIEKDLPRVEKDIDKVVLKYYRRANREFS